MLLNNISYESQHQIIEKKINRKFSLNTYRIYINKLFADDILKIKAFIVIRRYYSTIVTHMITRGGVEEIYNTLLNNNMLYIHGFKKTVTLSQFSECVEKNFLLPCDRKTLEYIENYDVLCAYLHTPKGIPIDSNVQREIASDRNEDDDDYVPYEYYCDDERNQPY